MEREQTKELILYYNNIYTPVIQNTQIVPEALCNSFTIINQGATVASINGILLYPGTPGTNNGESFVFGGNKGELFKGRLDISFPNGGIGEVMTVQKVYLPKPFNNQF